MCDNKQFHNLSHQVRRTLHGFYFILLLRSYPRQDIAAQTYLRKRCPSSATLLGLTIVPNVPNCDVFLPSFTVLRNYLYNSFACPCLAIYLCTEIITKRWIVWWFIGITRLPYSVVHFWLINIDWSRHCGINLTQLILYIVHFTWLNFGLEWHLTTTCYCV